MAVIRLARVRQAIMQDSRVEVVKTIEYNYLPGKVGCISHSVEFKLAPREPIFKARALNDLLLGLISPVFNGLMTGSFSETDDYLEFGYLSFDEIIGHSKITHETILEDSELYSCNGFVNEKMVQTATESLNRRVWVRLFPSKLLAESGPLHGIRKTDKRFYPQPVQ